MSDETEVKALTKVSGWCYCRPEAISGRQVIVQATVDTAVGWTQSGRIIISLAKIGKVGEGWIGGEKRVNGNLISPQSFGLAYLGRDGSVDFARQIGAKKNLVEFDPFRQCLKGPDLQYMVDKATIARSYPGVVLFVQSMIAEGRWDIVKQCIYTLEKISDLSWGRE